MLWSLCASQLNRHDEGLIWAPFYPSFLQVKVTVNGGIGFVITRMAMPVSHCGGESCIILSHTISKLLILLLHQAVAFENITCINVSDGINVEIVTRQGATIILREFVYKR